VLLERNITRSQLVKESNATYVFEAAYMLGISDFMQALLSSRATNRFFDIDGFVLPIHSCYFSINTIKLQAHLAWCYGKSSPTKSRIFLPAR
jgi:hypothetical protein